MIRRVTENSFPLNYYCIRHDGLHEHATEHPEELGWFYNGLPHIPVVTLFQHEIAWHIAMNPKIPVAH